MTLHTSVTGYADVDIDGTLGTFLFLQAHERSGNVYLCSTDIPRALGPVPLPDDVTVVQVGAFGKFSFVIGEVEGAYVLVRSYHSSGVVVVSAPTAEAADALRERVVARVPPGEDDGLLPVTFADHQLHNRVMRIEAPSWADTAGLYPAAVRGALDTLMAHRPDAAESRRLMVWHGDPGTGKTTAARALLREWHDWAEGVVVSDPESLLSDGRYLRRIVLDTDDAEKWSVVVLEDAEALLHTSTKATSALGKLLNLADGMLGQGLRCLFLLTTNEPVGALHPALVRPGRCLARIEFTRLSAAETATLLGRPVERGQTLAEVMSARAVATEAEPEAVGQYL